MRTESVHRSDNRLTLVTAFVALLLLALFAWYRLDLLNPYETVRDPSGALHERPNAIATVDHPFHAARFGLLLDALRDGHPLRWVSSHQGGYPAEFYPFGSTVVDLAVWLATLGQLPIPLEHTYGVGVVFLLPLVGFLALARMSELPAWAAVAGAAAHLCVRGWWWSGGSMELVEWGLVTNVAAATWLFLALVPAAALLKRWSSAQAVALALLLALAIVTNPRSAIAVAALFASWLVLMLLERADLPRALRRMAVPAILALLLSTPVWLPLLRYREHYYFVHYSGYADAGEWIESSVQAVSGPVFAVALFGLAVGLTRPVAHAYRLVVVTLVLYSAVTLYLVEVRWPASLVEQLETTRLMPFQRLLVLGVALLGLGWLAARLAGRLEVLPLAAAALAIVVLYVASPPAFIPEGDRGLLRQTTFAHPSLLDLEQGVQLADDLAPPTSAILILGSTVSWHSQLWAPLWTERRLFYDDWLWYWQQRHVGPYDPRIEHAYRDDAATLTENYLTQHGIGAVVVTGDARGAARRADALALQREGAYYDVYTVRQPQGLISLDRASVEDVVVDDTAVTISTAGRGGSLLVRENWFPRWTARADGQPLPVQHRQDGYIGLDVPDGVTTIELRYAVTRLDWLARGASLFGAVGCVALLLSGLTPTARSAPRSASAGSGHGPTGSPA